MYLLSLHGGFAKRLSIPAWELIAKGWSLEKDDQTAPSFLNIRDQV